MMAHSRDIVPFGEANRIAIREEWLRKWVLPVDVLIDRRIASV